MSWLHQADRLMLLPDHERRPARRHCHISSVTPRKNLAHQSVRIPDCAVPRTARPYSGTVAVTRLAESTTTARGGRSCLYRRVSRTIAARTLLVGRQEAK